MFYASRREMDNFIDFEEEEEEETTTSGAVRHGISGKR